MFSAAVGHRERAVAVLTDDLAETSRHDLHYALWVAEGLSMIGEIDRALEMLTIAIDRGYIANEYFERHDWLLDPLRGDSRFAELMRQARERSMALREI